MKKGFSLIETAMAIALLALIIGGMLEVFRQGFAAAKKSGARTIAVNLAREKLEEYSRVPLPSNGSPAETEGYGDIVNFAEFRRTVDVSDYIFPAELKRISVTVYWNGDQDSLVFETLKAAF